MMVSFFWLIPAFVLGMVCGLSTPTIRGQHVDPGRISDQDQIIQRHRVKHGGRSNPHPDELGISRPAPPPAPPARGKAGCA